MDFISLVLDLCHLGFTSLPRGFARSDLTTLIYGCSRMDFSVLILDLIKIGFTTSVHSFVCLGLLLLIFGIGCLGFSLLVLDFVALGSTLSLHGLTQLEPTLFTIGLADVNFGLYPHGQFAPLEKLCLNGFVCLNLWHELPGVSVICTGSCSYWFLSFFAWLLAHWIYPIYLWHLVLGLLAANS